MPRSPISLVPNAGWDERVSVLRCGSVVDSFAVRTESWLVLIDTLVSREAMASALDLLPREDRSRPLLVINTHGDWDHVWGNGLFAGPDAVLPAPILGSERTGRVMRSPDAAETLARKQAEDPEEFATASIQPPTLRFAGEAAVDAGELTFHLLPSPGHTADHLAVWVPEIRLLFAGDAAEAPLPWVTRGDDIPVLRASLRRLAALEPAQVLYCHAPGRHDAALIMRNLRYFDDLEARCRQATGPDAVKREWPLEEAIGDLFPPPDQVPFYRAAHHAAIAAMSEWLRPVAELPR